MKVKQEDEQVNFKPITLTIETKEELKLILSFVGSLSVNTASKIADGYVSTQEAYDALSLISEKCGISSFKFLSISTNQEDLPIE